MVSPSDTQDKKNTGWLSKVFGKGRHTDNTNTHELADKSTVQNAPELKIEALLDSVNNASQHVRNFYITFLVVGFYIAMIVWSTTDVMLLKETPVKLPILDVELPVTGFYWFAPFFYLLLHFNLLLQLGLLSDKINRFDDAVATLEDDDTREYYYSRLFSFAFTQALSGRQHSWFLKFLLTLMVWITIIWLPLGLLIGLQVGFLAYHGENILFWQRVAIGLDLVFLAIFWPIIRSQDGHWLTWIRQVARNIVTSLVACFSPIRQWISWWLPIPREMKQSKVYLTLIQYSQAKFSGKLFFESNVIIITLVSVVVFSWGVAVLPDSKNEQTMAKIIPEKWLTEGSLRDVNNKDHRYFRLTEYLFDKTYQKHTNQTQESIFNRNLIIKEQLLIANELAAEVEADISSKNDELRETALKKVENLVLSGRDFRYADFSEARLPKVDFIGANDVPSKLSYANLGTTMLSKARMDGVELQGAVLNNADLQNATLNNANLEKSELINTNLKNAELKNTNFQNAELKGANFQGTNLSHTKFQNSNLKQAKFQGVDISTAKFQNATLEKAKLQGSSLYRANLRNINLKRANLKGAYLYKADLQNADLTNADLRGANLHKTNLQEADLTEAKLEGATLLKAILLDAILTNTKLTLSDITSAKFGPTNNTIPVDLFEIPIKTNNSESYKQFNKLSYEKAKKHTTLSNASGKNILVTETDKYAYPILYSFGNKLEVAKDELDYQYKLTTNLVDLSCHNRWITSGIVNYRVKIERRNPPFPFRLDFAECLLSLEDKKNKSGQYVCPALSDINEDTATKLKSISARKFLAETTQLPFPFECKTKLSDPPPESDSL